MKGQQITKLDIMIYTNLCTHTFTEVPVMKFSEMLVTVATNIHTLIHKSLPLTRDSL